MNWLDIHKRRLANEGNSIKEAYSLQTVNFIENAFLDSPTSLIVEINDKKYEARLLKEKKYSVASGYEVKKILFKPYTKVGNGEIAIIEDEKWLIVFFEDKELAPKAYIRFCNNNLEFKNGNSYPCVIDSRINTSQKINEEVYVDLPSDTLKITVSYNEDTKNIRENDRFVINGLAWEVQGFDRITQVYDENGIVELAMKKVPLKESEIKPIPEEPIPIPKDNYFIEIQGNKEVEINSVTTFVAKVYLNGNLVSMPIEWSVTTGTITDKGEFTAPTVSGLVTITAKCIYTDNNKKPQLVETTKDIEIFNNDDWGWG